jgi:glutamyl-tRNA reductase
MPRWLAVAIQCSIAHLAGAFLSRSALPVHRDVPAAEKHRNAAGLRRHVGDTSREKHADSVFLESSFQGWAHTASIAAGLCGIVIGAARRKTPSQKGLQGLRLAALNATTGSELATREKEDIDMVESALTSFVPKISALRNQAQVLRSGELKQVIETMQELRKTELRNVFGEVDQLLCALVDAIQNLQESAIQIRKDELRQDFDQLDIEALSNLENDLAHMMGSREALPLKRLEVDTMMEVHVVGLSHHSAPVHVRELLAVPQARWNEFAQELVEFARTSSGYLVPEVAVLSTCNRFELYFASPELKKYPAVECVLAFLRHKSGLSREELEPYLFVHSGSDATSHLFEVSSGLDSLVLGEAQILAQVKACHEHCILKGDVEDESVTPGYGGKIISKMLNAGIRMGKLARTRTRIGEGAVSVSSAAVELMIARSMGDLRKQPANLKVCIVGAGKMSRLLLLALFSKHPDIHLTLVARKVDQAQALLEEVAPRGGSNAQVVSADQMWDTIGESDVVFTSTSSPTPIISASDLQSLNRKLMLIDISVPLNVAPDCGNVAGVTSYNVDDLKRIQEANNKAREAEVSKAKVLIDEQAHNFRIWQASQGAVPYLASMQAMAEKIRQTNIEKMSSRLKGLHDKEMEAVDKLTRLIISQLFSPVYYSMKDEEDLQAKKSKIWALKNMFRLEPLYKRRNLLMDVGKLQQLTA